MADRPPPPGDTALKSMPAPTGAVDATVINFRAAIGEGDFQRAGRIAAVLPPADLRDALSGLNADQTMALFEQVGDGSFAALVDRLNPEDAGIVLRRLPNPDAADVLDELAPDDAADVIEAIKANIPERAEPILVEMDRAGDVQSLLAHLPDTAGGRMTTDFLVVRPEATAEEAIRALRDRVREGEFRSYLYVIDENNRLVGVVPLYRLVLVDPQTRIVDFMVRDPVRVSGTDDQENVARLFRERRFLALPVVDFEGRLIWRDHSRRHRRRDRTRGNRGYVPHGWHRGEGTGDKPDAGVSATAGSLACLQHGLVTWFSFCRESIPAHY